MLQQMLPLCLILPTEREREFLFKSVWFLLVPRPRLCLQTRSFNNCMLRQEIS